MSFRRFDPNKPVSLSGVVRLADKYLIEPLREHLVEQVVSDWPQTLDEWEKWKAEISRIEKGLEKSERLCDHIPEPVTAINFATKFPHFRCSQSR